MYAKAGESERRTLIVYALQVHLPAPAGPHNSQLAALFAEELGLVIEVAADKEEEVLQAYAAAGLTVSSIGRVTSEASISISVDDQPCISGSVQARILSCTRQPSPVKLQMSCLLL